MIPHPGSGGSCGGSESPPGASALPFRLAAAGAAAPVTAEAIEGFFRMRALNAFRIQRVESADETRISRAGGNR